MESLPCAAINAANVCLFMLHCAATTENFSIRFKTWTRKSIRKLTYFISICWVFDFCSLFLRLGMFHPFVFQKFDFGININFHHVNDEYLHSYLCVHFKLQDNFNFHSFDWDGNRVISIHSHFYRFHPNFIRMANTPWKSSANKYNTQIRMILKLSIIFNEQNNGNNMEKNESFFMFSYIYSIFLHSF